MTPERLADEIDRLDAEGRERLLALLRERPALRDHLRPAMVEPEPLASSADYLIVWDGGSKGNPGDGYGSYRVTAVKSGRSRIERLTFPGRMTNNEAEYETLISALKTLAARLRDHERDPADFDLDLRGDSLLVINQVSGRWKAKDARMAKYRNQVRALLKEFGAYDLTHHKRSHSVTQLGH